MSVSGYGHLEPILFGLRQGRSQLTAECPFQHREIMIATQQVCQAAHLLDFGPHRPRAHSLQKLHSIQREDLRQHEAVGRERNSNDYLSEATGTAGVYRIDGPAEPGRFDWRDDRPPRHSWSKTVIYETHVRGFTRDVSSGVQCPGTYRGLTEKIPYLKDLGVTAVELLPVQEFNPNALTRCDPQSGRPLRNYWGYDPVAFFAVNGTYSSSAEAGQQTLEFKEMVRQLHVTISSVFDPSTTLRTARTIATVPTKIPVRTTASKARATTRVLSRFGSGRSEISS